MALDTECFMLSIANWHSLLSVVMLSVVMLSVVAPNLQLK
jgi:hypothetical protein